MENLNKTQKRTRPCLEYPKICEMKLISIRIRSFTLLENVRVSALAINRL